ncbi:MAG TPA: pseudouridine synthase [Candidatus Polarisedimenticolia bacterium]|nr:pseudouridine synthase [Candidatus Polarisedimenticolia bacterium]
MNRGYEYRHRIEAGGAGMTVVSYLAWRYPHTPLAGWRGRALEGRVLLDGSPAEPEAPVRTGQTVIWVRPPWREPDAPLSFAVLFRDDHLLGVLKPAGLPTLPGGGFLDHTLLRVVRRAFPGATPAHRIGRGTTGLVLCTRSEEASVAVGSAWRRGEVRKFYRALVSGHPRRERFSVDTPIGRIPLPRGAFQAHAATPEGKRALSHVRVLEHRESNSLVEVEIVTGRPHQVRIHLAAAGHRLVGESFYGPGGQPLPDSAVGPGGGGFFLHSYRLLLKHPVDARHLDLEAPPPPVLRMASEH